MIIDPRSALPGTVFGRPSIGGGVQPIKQSLPPKPGQGLKRCLQYNADYAGCGYWRMLWPADIINGGNKMIIASITQMITDEQFYRTQTAVRLQRQAHPNQLKFFKKLRESADKYNFKVIYEIDDIVFREDIPDYNKFKTAFTDDAIRNSIEEMMNMADEITVSCDHMRDYYKSKIKNQSITTIRNHPPKLWLNGFYNEDTLLHNYNQHVKKKRKPRVLYAGSGAHYDVDNKTGQVDDFTHVRDVIRKTHKDIQWVFIGAVPPPLKDLEAAGKIEFHKWVTIYELPEFIQNLKINCLIAPLIDNTFNRSKSDVKFLEACALGVPLIAQDMITYQNAILKFSTGDEMIDQLKKTLQDKQTYMKYCRRHREYIRTQWLDLEQNYSKHIEVLTTPYGCETRKFT